MSELLDIEDREQVLATLELCAYSLTRMGLTEEDTPDTLGRVNKVINSLSSYKRTMLSEMQPTKGDNYRVVSGGRSAKRSYSSAAIFTDFMEAMDLDLTGVLFWLREKDALRFTWRWSQLQQAFDSANVTMKIAKHEITDDEADAHVGEVWTEKPAVLEGIEE